MKRDLTQDVERVMDNFLATATDDEFWAALEDAGWAEFSKIDLPVLEYHSKVAHYVVAGREMMITTAASTDISMVGVANIVQGQLTVGNVLMGCDVGEAANSNELALAA